MTDDHKAGAVARGLLEAHVSCFSPSCQQYLSQCKKSSIIQMTHQNTKKA